MKRGFGSSKVVSRIQSLVATRNYPELSKALCANGITDEKAWLSIVDSVLNLVDPKEPSGASGVVIPSLVIASAAGGHSLTYFQRNRIGDLAVSLFDSLSEFDKLVFTIGCSQAGLRTPSVVDFVSRFLTVSREGTQFSGIPEKFIPELLLAVATLGIDNQLSWNQLLAKVDFENLTPHALTQTALAIATSRTFPISAIERMIDGSVSRGGGEAFSFEDALCFAHSLTCLEVFHTQLFRSLLVRISNAPTLEEDGKNILKQIVISLFLDEKAKQITESISPIVLGKLDKFLDWSVPEPQRHHGLVAGEIQQLISVDESDMVMKQPVAVGSIADWTRESALSVAVDRFYVSDVLCSDPKLFVHIDDETYPDIIEGPLDPYLQVKHLHLRTCGMKLVWIREQEWLELEDEEKKELITNIHS